MAHFAHIENGIVDVVRVISKETLVQQGGARIDGVLKPVKEWVQTSYNTNVGDYKLGNTKIERDTNKVRGTAEDKAARNRKNYAGVGYTYDRVNDMFIPPKKYPSWTLNTTTGWWDAPKSKPKRDGRYGWDERLQDWVKFD